MLKNALDPSKEVVYSIPWQILRVQLLARNSLKGGFDTLEGVKDNIEKLKDYLGSKNDINKVYRCLNLLNAARMGYASKNEIGSDKDKVLVKFRDDLDEIYRDLKEKGKEFTSDSSEQISKDIKKAPADWLMEVEKDLRSRKQQSDPETTNEALDNFLNIVQKEVAKLEKNSSQYLVAKLKKLANDLECL